MQEFFAKIKTRLLTCSEAINNFETFKGIIVLEVNISNKQSMVYVMLSCSYSDAYLKI